MKKFFLVAAFLMVSLYSATVKAQVSISVNIGLQPLWGPTGYNHVDYYYLPDVDAYYYVPTSQYIFLDNGRWIWANNLPTRYRNFDLYKSYKVVMNTPNPYLQHNVHVKQYISYKNYGGKQAVIRDSRDARYTGIKSYPSSNNRPNNNTNRTIQKSPVAVRAQNNSNTSRNQGTRSNNVGRPERGSVQGRG